MKSSSIRRKYGLTAKAMLIVVPLLALKVVLHFADLEIITVGPVITALIAGVFFVIAMLLSGVMSDFKEGEKIPSELTASIDAIQKDMLFLEIHAASNGMRAHVADLLHTVISNFEKKGRWSVGEVNKAIDRIDDDLIALGRLGAPIALLLKLRNELGNVKRISNRVEVIKEVTFLPTGQALAEFSTGVALLVLLFLKVDPFYEGLMLTGVISLILVNIVLLIRDMDNPFEGHATVDLRQLYKLDKYLDAK